MIAVASASAAPCVASFSARVVGADPAGTRVLVRVEGDPAVDGSHTITLRALDVPSGAVARTWAILRPEDGGDPTARGANWKRAEAEAAALGLLVTPDAKPLWDAGPQAANSPVPVRVGGATVALGDLGLGRPGEVGSSLGVTITPADGSAPRQVRLATWPLRAPIDQTRFPTAVWGIPGDRAVVVVAVAGCAEPSVYVVPVAP